MQNESNAKLITETKTSDNSQNKYWLTLEDWRNDKDFRELAEQEFLNAPHSLTDNDHPEEGGWARREFLKLMGASLALTSFGCVRRPAEKIVPYVKRPTEVVEGIPNYYSSAWNDGSEVFGLVVKTREGRPIKVEGNSFHPANRGGMSARAYAHLLSLYDPDRLGYPVRHLFNEGRTNFDRVRVSFEAADEAIVAQLKKGSVALLTSSLVSPSLQNVVQDFKNAFSVRHYVWEPLGAEQHRLGQELSFGQSAVPTYRFDKAYFILSVGADFLGTYIAPTEQQKAFSQMRNPDSEMNQLVVFEPLLSLTGANADFRVRIRSTEMADVLMGLLHEIVVKQKQTRFASDTQATNILKAYSNVAEQIGLSQEIFSRIAKDLYDHRGKSIVIAGEDLKAQLAANWLNVALGNDGTTIDYRNTHTGFQGSTKDLVQLVSDIQEGRIKTLIIHGVNPVYSTPEELGFAEALRKLEMAVYTGSHPDETGVLCEYIIPDDHPMEAWGDIEGKKGQYAIQQPTLRPLGETSSFGQTLIAWMEAADKKVKTDSWYEYVKMTAASKGVSGDTGWEDFLEKGVVDTTSFTNLPTRNLNSRIFNELSKKETPKADLELVLYPTVGLRDGTMANVSWLQEFPDPVTKICWDNYVTLSPANAEARKIRQGQIVKVNVGSKSFQAPAHIQPGQHDHVIGLAFGYGHTRAGQIANGVGVNAYRFVHFNKNELQSSGLTATLEKTSTFSPLANVAGHNSMEGRQIVVEATLADYKKNPQANIHRHKIFSAWSPHQYTSYKWGMSIDLTSCIGCSACMVACQSENNIPVVGKKYVINGREMHWMRIDRYYVGQPSDPNTVFMPVNCMHCDNAPCETVCPVLATVHSDEGTNDMIYNRCVGTRYCANNCPYKVRRFNWFNYVKTVQSPQHMALNPDVTVRSRGVMEKCTFCKHRIESAKSKAKLEGRRLKDGEVTTACQDSCPTGAIVFGDTNDPESLVYKILKKERTYTLLEELNASPAVKYQSKIRNTVALKTDKKKKGSH